jgi:hypothetical protein
MLMKHIRSTLCYQGLQEKFTKKEKALKTSRAALIEEISTRDVTNVTVSRQRPYHSPEAGAQMCHITNIMAAAG